MRVVGSEARIQFDPFQWKYGTAVGDAAGRRAPPLRALRPGAVGLGSTSLRCRPKDLAAEIGDVARSASAGYEAHMSMPVPPVRRR
jgi:hypothetical protein